MRLLQWAVEGSFKLPKDRRLEPIDALASFWEGVTFICMKFRVTVEPDEDGVFVAECPALPGCVSQGKTREEAIANIRDAIQGYIDSLKKHGEPIPSGMTEEIVEIPA